MSHKLYLGDNLPILEKINSHSVNLIYIDPPFNTGKRQKYQGNQYEDSFDTLQDYLDFLHPRVREGYRCLKVDGSFFLHVDYRAVHYCKVMLDKIFGIDCFMNEIIWAYDYGARQKDRWATKHDNILWYVKNPGFYTFNYEQIERVPYMSTKGMMGLTEEKIKKGKTLTDVWWQTIASTNGDERVGYPTQKPLRILSRIVQIHSNPGDVVMDYFAGSGTTGEAAAQQNRSSILIDKNPEAIDVIRHRLGLYGVELIDVRNEEKVQ